MKKTDMSRRHFIKTSALSAAIAGMAPQIVASDKTGTRLPVLGVGEHQYEAIHDWGELPAGHVYGNTHGVAVDKEGFIHIKHTVGAGAKVEDAIVVFDAEGKFVRSWGRKYKGGAHGLHLNVENGEEYLYLCDPKRHMVAKTNLKGDEIWRIWAPESCKGYHEPDEYRPTNVATSPNGDFFVADGYGRSFIHQYNHEAKLIRTFGGKGKDAGQTDCPHGLMVDMRSGEGKLVVADRSNHRLQYFTLNGEHIGFVTDSMSSPCHFHTRGEVMVVPDLDSRVSLLDKENKLICQLGEGSGYAGIRDKTRDAFTPGKFVAPHSAFFDHDGNIFIVEWVEVGRVTKLRRLA
jgi:hypothetical protein